MSTIYWLLIAQPVLCYNINRNRLTSIGLKGFKDTRSKFNENYLLSINYYKKKLPTDSNLVHQCCSHVLWKCPLLERKERDWRGGSLAQDSCRELRFSSQNPYRTNSQHPVPGDSVPSSGLHEYQLTCGAHICTYTHIYIHLKIKKKIKNRYDVSKLWRESFTSKGAHSK